jgi:hypothetical protein
MPIWNLLASARLALNASFHSVGGLRVDNHNGLEEATIRTAKAPRGFLERDPAPDGTVIDGLGLHEQHPFLEFVLALGAPQVSVYLFVPRWARHVPPLDLWDDLPALFTSCRYSILGYRTIVTAFL